MGRVCRRSGTRARASRARCTTATMHARCASCIRNARVCKSCQTMRVSSFRSHSSTSPAHGPRCLSQATAWYARDRMSCTHSSLDEMPRRTFNSVASTARHSAPDSRVLRLPTPEIIHAGPVFDYTARTLSDGNVGKGLDQHYKGSFLRGRANRRATFRT